MLAQLEVKEINSRTFKDFTDFQGLPSPGIFFPIQGLSRIFKARGHPEKGFVDGHFSSVNFR
jgi:hypothetical protein